MTCKDCIHRRVCFKQYMRDKITPKGFELQCINFKNKANFVEVVRCGECKHWRPNGLNRDGDGHCFWTYLDCEPDEFCNYGERKIHNGKT